MSAPRKADGFSECPAWCAGGADEHARAIDEGVELDLIEHRSVDLGIRLATLRHPNRPKQILRECPGKVAMSLSQDAQTLPFGGYPLIELEVTSALGHDTRLDLTTGEARTLAAQLLHLADQEELHADRGGAR